MLDQALVLPRGLEQQLALVRVVGARFLHVDVLACRAAKDRSRGMPVVAGGNHKDIDILPLEDATKVSYRLNPSSQALRSRFRPLAVHVTAGGTAACFGAAACFAVADGAAGGAAACFGTAACFAAADDVDGAAGGAAAFFEEAACCGAAAVDGGTLASCAVSETSKSDHAPLAFH